MIVSRPWRLAPLLTVSGFCALVEQVVWERELRLVFGVTTAASAAVIAIFIAGLGFGGLWFGRRVDRSPSPLRTYGHLELGIAALVAVSPLSIALVRHAYVAAGGSSVLGGVGGTLVRLALSAAVLGPPSFLMGGTLPAAVRAVQDQVGARREAIGLLYGVNTMGAVAGCLASSLWLVEVFGNRMTLLLAALLVALVGVTARAMSRGQAFDGAQSAAQEQPSSAPGAAKRSGNVVVIVAAAVVGFAFFVMELIAPRMLAPLLGGTVFTFGIVLGVALVGIAAGGFVYGRFSPAPTLRALALTCSLEALAFALPLVLGDQVALLALRLRGLLGFGFGGYVVVACAISSILLLPGALVSGYQFPLLIALIGEGRERVGGDVGRAYAANTFGSMIGALSGGFLLIPTMGAVGAWRAVVCVLATASLAMIVAGAVRGRWRMAANAWAGAVALAAVALGTRAEGPTAVWRHSGIGAGRASMQAYQGVNAQRAKMHHWRGAMLEEHDGRESSMAILSFDELQLMVGGKADGSTRGDAATQVGSALLPALRHPQARVTLVVGLATGCTAGWLAALPQIERVDVVELEPDMERMSILAAPVNERVLANPKVHLRIADAREHLLTTRDMFDLVVSEPSNPYRAGVAALYTQEFYQAVAAHLRPGGVFVQWIQAYEVDSATIRMAAATLASVFPHAELWELASGDLALFASGQPLVWEPEAMRARIAEPVMQRGLRAAFGVDSLEGVLARLRGVDGFLQVLVGESSAVNTDDQNFLEFSFARTLGNGQRPRVDELMELSRAARLDRPALAGASVDWERVADERASAAIMGDPLPQDPSLDGAARARASAKQAYASGHCEAAWEQWRAQPAPALAPAEKLLVAECATEVGSPTAGTLRKSLSEQYPAEAALLEMRARCREAPRRTCAEAISIAIPLLRTEPWVHLALARRALAEVLRLGSSDATVAAALDQALSVPFAALNLEDVRRTTRAEVTAAMKLPQCRACFEQLEPYPPWNSRMLRLRQQCYEMTASPLAARAAAEVQAFAAAEDAGFLGN